MGAEGGVVNERDFYPRSPCGERPFKELAQLMGKLFLSTLSLRRATIHLQDLQAELNISIHALLAESDNPGGG